MTSKIKTKLQHYFIETLGARDYRRGWLKCDCPMCGKRDKFGINLYQNRTNCFSCGYNERPIYLLIDLENLLTVGEAYKYLGTVSEATVFYERIITETPEIKVNRKLPEGYINIMRGDNKIGRIMRKYVKKRGFDLDRVSKKGWGYSYTGKYLGHLIMPYYMGNELIYFNARKVIGAGPKFNNPPLDEFGIGKAHLVYNVDSLYLYDKIYLVESVTNAETIGDNTIATGGKNLSPFQKNLILKSPVKRVSIALDKDGYDLALNLALQLCEHKQVKILEFEDDRDVNDLGRRKTLILDAKSRYLNYQQIIKKKLDYEGSKYSYNGI